MGRVAVVGISATMTVGKKRKEEAYENGGELNGGLMGKTE